MKNKKKRYSNKRYSLSEEIFNSLSHGLGVLIGIFGLLALISSAIKASNNLAILAFSLYGLCFILMFLSSTLYHSISNEKAKSILRVFDHSSIFLFIAGSYTPICLLAIDGPLKIVLLLIIWALAIFGIVFKILTSNKLDSYRFVSMFLYLFMGWFVIFTAKPIIENTSFSFFIWLLGGGLLYTLGTIFFNCKKLPFNHGIWHIFVLAASVFHLIGIYKYLI